jgi:hypothetical protein
MITAAFENRSFRSWAIRFFSSKFTGNQTPPFHIDLTKPEEFTVPICN